MISCLVDCCIRYVYAMAVSHLERFARQGFACLYWGCFVFYLSDVRHLFACLKLDTERGERFT